MAGGGRPTGMWGRTYANLRAESCRVCEFLPPPVCQAGMKLFCGRGASENWHVLVLAEYL